MLIKNNKKIWEEIEKVIEKEIAKNNCWKEFII